MIAMKKIQPGSSKAYNIWAVSVGVLVSLSFIYLC